MQPLQYDLRDPAVQNYSITHAAAAPSNLDTAITMRSAQAELQNTKELRATTQKNYAQRHRNLQLHSRISTPKQEKDDFEILFQNMFTRKITNAKIEKIC